MAWMPISAMLFVGTFTLTVAVPVSVPPQRDVQASQELNWYTAIVERYRAGEIDAAVKALLSLERSVIERALAELPRSPDWTTSDIEAAAMLHTEVALRASSFVDFHLGVARDLIHLNGGTRLRAEFQRQWYLAVAWSLQKNSRLEDAAPYLDAMVKRFPNDGDVLLALGSFYEALGWSREPPIDLAPLSDSPRGGASPVSLQPQILERVRGRNQRRIQELAAATLQKALAASPALDEAHLRLGRLWNELDRPIEALTVLTPLRERAADLDLRYLAALFAGAAYQHAGQLSSAVDAYRVATTFYPRCQTPWIALSHALNASGARSDASEIMQRLAVTGPDCDDPWWNYRSGLTPWRLQFLLEQLRREIAR